MYCTKYQNLIPFRKLGDEERARSHLIHTSRKQIIYADERKLRGARACLEKKFNLRVLSALADYVSNIPKRIIKPQRNLLCRQQFVTSQQFVCFFI